jgi:ribosomal protein L40E
MKIYGDRKRRAIYYKLCVGILILLILSASGCGLQITPNPLVANLIECESYSTTFSPDGQTCPTGPFTYFYWLSGSPPSWVILDEDTGELTACPPLGSAGNYDFFVGVTEMYPAPYCASDSPAAPVTLVVAPAAPPPDPLNIVPTFVWAWSMETMPFYLPLIATGCAGNYEWSATGLPPGLSLDPLTGEITGVPPIGSAGIYNVDVTVADNTYCADCCPPASRPFILVIDSYAAYLDAIIYGSYYNFTVQIGPGLAEGTTPVLIDGSLQTTLGGNQSATYQSHVGEMHLVSVEQTVSGVNTNTRYRVKGQYQILASDSNVSAYFDYDKEMFVQTSSEPAGLPQPPGTDYYAMGDTFISTAASPLSIDTQQDTRYIFKQWILPDGSTNPNRDLTFTVNNTGNVKAVYDTYYLLTLQSEYPPVNESSWELKDSTASYDLAQLSIPMTGFWGFLGGKLVPKNGSGTVLMNSPITKTITWAYNVTIPIIIIVVILLIIGLAIFFTIFFRRRGDHKASSVDSALPDKKEPAQDETKEKADFCPKCGAHVDEDADFCKKCGHKIN